LPAIIDDIFENKADGKFTNHQVERLTSYLAERVESFKEYPLKAIEEIAKRLE
jgi:hypothetical protein